MELQDIGFNTLYEDRARLATQFTKITRAEIVLGSECNLKCTYCRKVGGKNMPSEFVIDYLKALESTNRYGFSTIRFSGGEPTMHPEIELIVRSASLYRHDSIAISTNGTGLREMYSRLIDEGVNDFSVSLDACCGSEANKMAGMKNFRSNAMFERIIHNIEYLSHRVYTTVGVVLTQDNIDYASNIIRLANTLGVHDIRVIPAAQFSSELQSIYIPPTIKNRYPILKYRLSNMEKGTPVRGLSSADSHKCGLVLDDLAIVGGWQYPCIIYAREGGKPIGKMQPSFRPHRLQWYENHDTHEDPICKNQCLDVCREYNNRYEWYKKQKDQGTSQFHLEPFPA